MNKIFAVLVLGIALCWTASAQTSAQLFNSISGSTNPQYTPIGIPALVSKVPTLGVFLTPAGLSAYTAAGYSFVALNVLQTNTTTNVSIPSVIVVIVKNYGAPNESATWWCRNPLPPAAAPVTPAIAAPVKAEEKR